LTYAGNAITVPEWDWKAQGWDTPLAQIHTPVGDFRAFDQPRQWMPHHIDMYFEESSEAVTSEELRRGWYDAFPANSKRDPNVYTAYIRKTGTPDDWCLLSTNTTARWIRPDIVNDRPW
jgi:hypothetical protein